MRPIQRVHDLEILPSARECIADGKNQKGALPSPAKDNPLAGKSDEILKPDDGSSVLQTRYGREVKQPVRYGIE